MHGFVTGPPHWARQQFLDVPLQTGVGHGNQVRPPEFPSVTQHPYAFPLYPRGWPQTDKEHYGHGPKRGPRQIEERLVMISLVAKEGMQLGVLVKCAPPLRASIPEGYGDAGFQATALIFPTEACWETTGKVGEASLTFVTRVVKVGSASEGRYPPWKLRLL